MFDWNIPEEWNISDAYVLDKYGDKIIDFKKNIASEEDQLHPKEMYGTMKLAGEIITRGLGIAYNIPYTIIRPSAVYGPTDMNERVTQYFIEKAFRGEKLLIHGKNEKLDFTFVEDLAEAIKLSLINQKKVFEIFNIGSNNLISVKNLVKKWMLKEFMQFLLSDITF